MARSYQGWVIENSSLGILLRHKLKTIHIKLEEPAFDLHPHHLLPTTGASRLIQKKIIIITAPTRILSNLLNVWIKWADQHCGNRGCIFRDFKLRRNSRLSTFGLSGTHLYSVAGKTDTSFPVVIYMYSLLWVDALTFAWSIILLKWVDTS